MRLDSFLLHAVQCIYMIYLAWKAYFAGNDLNVNARLQGKG
jgi:hypothetical protein